MVVLTRRHAGTTGNFRIEKDKRAKLYDQLAPAPCARRSSHPNSAFDRSGVGAGRIPIRQHLEWGTNRKEDKGIGINGWDTAGDLYRSDRSGWCSIFMLISASIYVLKNINCSQPLTSDEIKPAPMKPSKRVLRWRRVVRRGDKADACACCSILRHWKSFCRATPREKLEIIGKLSAEAPTRWWATASTMHLHVKAGVGSVCRMPRRSRDPIFASHPVAFR